MKPNFLCTLCACLIQLWLDWSVSSIHKKVQCYRSKQTNAFRVRCTVCMHKYTCKYDMWGKLLTCNFPTSSLPKVCHVFFSLFLTQKRTDTISISYTLTPGNFFVLILTNKMILLIFLLFFFFTGRLVFTRIMLSEDAFLFPSANFLLSFIR